MQSNSTMTDSERIERALNGELVGDVATLLASRIKELETSIRKHRDQRGDDHNETDNNKRTRTGGSAPDGSYTTAFLEAGMSQQSGHGLFGEWKRMSPGVRSDTGD